MRNRFLKGLLHFVVFAQIEIRNCHAVIDSRHFVQMDCFLVTKTDECFRVIAHVLIIVITHSQFGRYTQQNHFPDMFTFLFGYLLGISLLALQNLLCLFFVIIPPPIESLLHARFHHIILVLAVLQPPVAEILHRPTDHRVFGQRLHGIGAYVCHAKPIQGF